MVLYTLPLRSFSSHSATEGCISQLDPGTDHGALHGHSPTLLGWALWVPSALVPHPAAHFTAAAGPHPEFFFISNASLYSALVSPSDCSIWFCKDSGLLVMNNIKILCYDVLLY